MRDEPPWEGGERELAPRPLPPSGALFLLSPCPAREKLVLLLPGDPTALKLILSATAARGKGANQEHTKIT